MKPENESSPATNTEWTFRFSAEEPSEPTITIIEGLAWLEDVDHCELTPLGTVIDAGALNDVVTETRCRDGDAPSSETSVTRGPSVSFEYEGYLVTVESDMVTIDPGLE